MATRVLVQCRTDEMPGSSDRKISLMANAACQKVWCRDFNNEPPDSDRLVTFGGWVNPQCFLLIDNGPVDAIEYPVVKLRWKGHELFDEPGPIHPYIRKEFETKYQFNPADRPKLIQYTDEELKKAVSSEVYNKHIKAKDEMIARGRQLR